MPASPSRLDFRGGSRTRSRSGSRYHGERLLSRSRSRSPRSERRARDDFHDGDRRRPREYDEEPGSRSRRRRDSRPEDSDSGRTSKRRRHHRHHHRRHDSPPREPAAALPYGARQLARSDLAAFRPLFAHYLDLQKQLDADALDETELRGRWKSFMGKWNRGELAEGWYDPYVFERAVRDYRGTREWGREGEGQGEGETSPSPGDGSWGREREHGSYGEKHGEDDDEDDDDDDAYGPPPPPPPGQHHQNPPPSRIPPPPSSTTRAPGPSIPNTSDLRERDESLAAARDADLTRHRLARRAHRAEHKALIDELLPPRADAGTRERRVEKRRELNEKLRGFRERSPGGGGMDVNEADLMGGGASAGGGGGDSLEEYKAMVQAREAKKKERVSRREEAERARRAEREERVREYRAREEKVVEGLRELARARFGNLGREGGGGT